MWSKLIFGVCGLCSGLKSSYVLIHIGDSGEEIQTSLPETAFPRLD